MENLLQRTTIAILLLALLHSPIVVGQLSGLPRIEPRTAPIVWGDITRDGKVDFFDFGRLVNEWDKTQDLYRDSNFKLFGSLVNNWAKTVPGALQQIKFENAGRLVAASPQSRKEGMDQAPSEKQVVGDQIGAIGFGVSFPNAGTRVNGIRLFAAPRDKLQNTQIQLPISSTDYPRFQTSQINSYTTYVQSFAEQMDIDRLDISVEARYALSNGSFRLDYDREFYQSEKNHKVIIKRDIDWGWWFLPPEDLVLDEGVRADLNAPGTAYDKYGTHYYYAEHRVSELYVEITIRSRRNLDRKTLAAQLEASLNFGGTDIDFATALSSIDQIIGEDSTAVVNVSANGPQLNFSFDPSRSSEENIRSASEAVRDWESEAIATQGLNVFAREFLARPVTDFIDGTPLAEFSRDGALRAWFIAYAELISRLDAIEDITNPTSLGVVFDQAYRHYAQLPLDSQLAALGYQNWLDYYNKEYAFLLDLRNDIFDVGEELFYATGDDTVFIRPTRFDIPSLFRPRIEIVAAGWQSCTSIGCRDDPAPSCRWWRPTIKIPGGDFTSGYRLEIEDNRGLFATTPIQQSLTYDTATDTTTFIFQVDGPRGYCEPCNTQFDFRLCQLVLEGGPGVAVLLYDDQSNRTNRLLAYGCTSASTCSQEVPDKDLFD